MDGEPIIELKHVSRSFGAQDVLRDVTVQVRRGETLAVIGESGCGKSVTLKLMTALMAPSSGDVEWYGRSIAGVPERKLLKLRLRFGYLFQGAALFDSMTVFDNVAFGLRENRTMPDSDIRQIVCDRLREIGLDSSICDKKPAELSGGMRKRVALARALALEPEVMFYDEPTTGLDPGYERRDQRIDSARPIAASGHQHRRHARYANGRKGVGSCGDVLPHSRGWVRASLR